MKTIEKIRKKIEELYDGEAPAHDQQCEFEDGYFTGIATISKFLDTLEEPEVIINGHKFVQKDGAITIVEAKEPVGEELEEAAVNWICSHKDGDVIMAKDAFFAGANWQKEQFEKNRLAACDAQTKEEYDREVDFATEIINKEHRQPTFSDAINYGIQLQKEQDTRDMYMSDNRHFQKVYELGKKDMKEQMMKDVVERTVKVDASGYPYIDATELYDYTKEEPLAKEGDKIKIVIFKEDE